MNRPQALGWTGPHGARTDYELVELLPQTGGQAFVFRAFVHGNRLGRGSDGREVALKQLITGAIGTAQTAEVVEVLKGRTHPALNRMLEVFTGPAPDPDGSAGDDDTLVYVASEWVPGRTADAAAETASLDEVLRWVTEIAGAVDYLHAHGHPGGPVCHRDIKPPNVIIDLAGDAVLIDPGLARAVSAGMSGSPHGSPGFIPPECVLDPRSSGPAGDRWQVGALLYTLLVGDPPGRADPELLRRRLRAVRRWRVPAALVDGVIAMLQPDPRRRPPHALRWALDLHAHRTTARRRHIRQPGRSAATFAIAALALVVVFGVGWFAHRPHRTTIPSTVEGPPGTAFLPVNSLVHLAAGSEGRAITVYNKVTNGATGMREDDPAYLSTVPDKYCALYHCAVDDTDMHSGVRLTAVCKTFGEVTTNGDDTNSVDATNPGRYTSRRYYGIRAPGGRFGYLSFVWVAPADRDGRGLPTCATLAASSSDANQHRGSSPYRDA